MKRIILPAVAVIAAVTLSAVAGWLAWDNKAQAQTDLPAPANVQVVNGDNPGEVVVSWDAVAGASGYFDQLAGLCCGLGRTSRRSGLAESHHVI